MRVLSSFAHRHPISLFVALTLIISWPPLVLHYLGEAGWIDFKLPVWVIVLYAQFGPSLAAVALYGLRNGRAGVADLYRRVTRWRIGSRHAAFAVLLFPVLGLLSYWAQSASAEPMQLLDSASLSSYLLVFAPAVLVGLLFGGLSEELGWRGFLQPELEKHWSWPMAGALVGIAWSLWHLELNAASLEQLANADVLGFAASWGQPMLMRIVETVPLAILMACLYRRTGGSLFAMMLIHAATNADIVACQSLWSESSMVYKATFIGLLWLCALSAIALTRAGERRNAVAAPEA